jgi:hypothetical protein
MKQSDFERLYASAIRNTYSAMLDIGSVAFDDKTLVLPKVSEYALKGWSRHTKYADHIKETCKFYSITSDDWDCLDEVLQKAFLKSIQMWVPPGEWNDSHTFYKPGKGYEIESCALDLTEEDVKILEEDAPSVYAAVVWYQLTKDKE